MQQHCMASERKANYNMFCCAKNQDKAAYVS